MLFPGRLFPVSLWILMRFGGSGKESKGFRVYYYSPGLVMLCVLDRLTGRVTESC